LSLEPVRSRAGRLKPVPLGGAFAMRADETESSIAGRYSDAQIVSPEVSAIITTHGRPDHVVHAIASIRAELHENVEFIVVVDGHDDLGVSETEVRVVRGEKLGVGRARNLGLDAALGEFVIFLDDDDIALPWRISTLLQAAKQSGSDLCFGLTRRVVVDGDLVLPDVPTGLTAPGRVEFSDILACAPHINAVLVRTSVLRDAGGFDADAHHFDDWSAWLRLADRNVRMWCIGQVVAEWRLHEAGLSGLVARRGGLKGPILSLFERLGPALSPQNASALGVARSTVMEREIQTYDDYADAMQQMQLVGVAHSR
jgi:glycosyltransferase involved in cell wall biosynthesis